jgi:hypothetical protein
LRDDRVQINCDKVDYYKAPQEQEPIATTEPVVPEAPIEAIHADTTPVERRRLVINISQTSDEDGDIARLSRIRTALQVFPGKDEVQLNIVNGGEATNLRLPIYTNYCPELKQHLVELVGEDGFRVEPYQ